MALAIVHVVGSLAVWAALSIFVVWLGVWEQERIRKRRLQEISIAFGVPISSLETEEHAQRLMAYASQRWSAELLRNRLSDLCGMVRTAWGWLGYLLQIAVVLIVGLQLFGGDLREAGLMWSVVGVALFFWLASVAFSYVCLLLTGRYPGEAKQGRAAISKLIEMQSAPEHFSKSADTVLLG